MKFQIVVALLVLFSVSIYAGKSVKLGSLCLNPVNCFVDPCRVSKCDAYPNAQCVSDYCGGCNTRWYLNGQEINCLGSMSKRAIEVPKKDCETVYCFVNPCLTTKCNKHPEAICQPNYCGGCNAWFYLGEERVQCD